jgi:hypothetical protein
MVDAMEWSQGWRRGIAMVDRNTTGRELERLHAPALPEKVLLRNPARL